MKNNKGVTLISLGIMIIVLLILASISIYSAKSTAKYTKFMKAKSEVELMQVQVNSWYAEYKRDGEDSDVLNYGVSIGDYTGNDETSDKFKSIKNTMYAVQLISPTDSNWEDDVLNKYRVFTFDHITNTLGIEGINYDFLIDIKSREIILLNGIIYKADAYYTPEDFGISNVDNVSIQGINFDEPVCNNVTYGKDKITAAITLNNLYITDGYGEKFDISNLKITCRNNQNESVEIKDYEKTADNTFAFKMQLNYSDNDLYTIKVATVDGKEKESTVEIKIPELTTKFGTIDVVWLDTNNNVISSPLAPWDHLNGMTGIYWDGSTEITVDTSNKSSWYSYTAGTDKEENTSSKWANAKNTDGSYFVWIPRYAYRITYYESQDAWKSGADPTGYYDGRGFVNIAGRKVTKINGSEIGEEKTSLDTGVQTVTSNGLSYIVHPAFETDLSLGGWDSDLAGFWVAKYEMSREDSSDGITWTPHGTSDDGGGNVTTESNTIRVVSKPGVTAWRSINIGDIYSNLYNYDRDKESHMIKSSEWGATAYLAHSKYGKNGYEVTINNNSQFYAGGSENAKASTNKEQNTTGNETGVFDMSGGSWERVAVFNDTDTDNHFEEEECKWTQATRLTVDSDSTKYATKYFNNTGSSHPLALPTTYGYGKTGDATKEVYTGNSIYNWFEDVNYSGFAQAPFFLRGGFCEETSEAGIFRCEGDIGSLYYRTSSRMVLSPNR